MRENQRIAQDTIVTFIIHIKKKKTEKLDIDLNQESISFLLYVNCQRSET